MAVYIADEQADVVVDTDRLHHLAIAVLADQDVPDAMEVSVLCVDREAMTDLNRTHMGGDGPTDVLAFPLDRPGEAGQGESAILGDVVLCPSVAADQAPEHGKSVQEEIDLLLVHGILHLLGHDHAEEEERTLMFGLTDRLLAAHAGGRRSEVGR
jgi:probable rRNA maturation factor